MFPAQSGASKSPPSQFPPHVPDEGGWHRMEKILRDVDKQKIKDSKEDIDTIFVFAGLFSAVVTAFLVESYKTLMPDPTTTMISLLQQIARQTSSFTFKDDSLNSTSSPSMSATLSFQPPLHAEVVNILWFMSLVLSLATASFGITVKYWLHEFLAGEYTSPQARLRIRHFRFPALSRWRVFEIVAILPLLIQASLAFFLVGICYFTADVYHSVGRATLAVVAAWAFLFVACALLPVYDAACPFKTPFFKTSWIYEILWSLWDKSLGRSDVRTTSQVAEEEITYDKNKDVEIILAVDAIQSDDHFLTSCMWTALQSAQEPEALIDFICGAIGHRLGLTARDIFDRLPNIAPIPKRTYSLLLDMVANVVEDHFDDTFVGPSNSGTLESDNWLKKSLRLLLIVGPDISRSYRVNRVVQRCLDKTSPYSLAFIRSFLEERNPKSNSPSPAAAVLTNLVAAFGLFHDTHSLLTVMYHLFRPDIPLPELLVPDTELPGARESASPTLDTIPVTYQETSFNISIQRLETISSYKFWTIYDKALLRQAVDFGGRDKEICQVRLVWTLRTLLCSSPAIESTISIYELALSPREQATADMARHLYHAAFLASGCEERTRILYRFMQCIESTCHVFHDKRFHEHTLPQDPSPAFVGHDRLDTYAACLLQLNIIDDISSHQGGKIYWAHRQLWARIFSSLENRLRLIGTVSSASGLFKFVPQAATCLVRIAHIVRHPKNKEMFDDSFIKALEHMHTGPVHIQCKSYPGQELLPPPAGPSVKPATEVSEATFKAPCPTPRASVRTKDPLDSVGFSQKELDVVRGKLDSGNPNEMDIGMVAYGPTAVDKLAEPTTSLRLRRSHSFFPIDYTIPSVVPTPR